MQISSISVKRSWGTCSSSSSSVPNRNCTLCDGVSGNAGNGSKCIKLTVFSVVNNNDIKLEVSDRKCVWDAICKWDQKTVKMYHKQETLYPPPRLQPDYYSSSCVCFHGDDASGGCGVWYCLRGREPRCRESCGLETHLKLVSVHLTGSVFVWVSLCLCVCVSEAFT